MNGYVKNDVDSGQGLDVELARSEAEFSDIIPGAEKKIIWFDTVNTKTLFSIIYLHGFSASRQEVSPLTENLAKKLGANLFLTRLTGHGQTPEAMAGITAENLLVDALDAFEIGKKIGERVIVVGMSTGATLATWLAACHQSALLAGVVLLSPNYGLASPKSNLLLKPMARYWLPLIVGRTYQFEPDNALQEKFWSWRYPTVALIPLMALVKRVTDLAFDKLTTPVLVLYSEEDKVVDVPKIRFVYDKIGAKNKQIHVITGTQGTTHHVLAGDILSPATTKKVESHILSFIACL